MRRTSCPTIRVVLLVVLTVGLAGCGDDRPPTMPTPPPALAISCPGPVTAQSPDGNAATVSFSAPTTVNGTGGVSVTCTPTSGSQFQVGTTPVSCTARDSAAPAQTANCTFNVVVEGPPRLQYTNFMTFGDSLTAGVISPAPFLLTLDLPGSYPSLLQSMLRLHYPTQTVGVYNAGNPGELAADEGLRRFRPELQGRRPEVVLLMEGTNDLLNRQAGANAALAALDTMITEAVSQNVKVCLATIPPQRAGGFPDRTIVAGLIPGFNDQIRALAARRNVPLIDVYEGMKDDLSLIGRDNLHPTALGYDVMARIFDEGIARIFKVGAPTAGYEARLDSASPASRTMRSNGVSR
jgi:lysophospholipase L1-like esterase